MAKVCVFLAEGFEEVEGLTVVDLLRRAGEEVTMVSVSAGRSVTGSHGITVLADLLFEDGEYGETDMLVLPGGMPGTLHLESHQGLAALLKEFNKKEKWIGAICAAPRVLGGLGLLEGRRAVCYPGVEDKLIGAETDEQSVAVDGHIITSRAVGTAISFALALIEKLEGTEKSLEIKKSIVY